MVRGAGSKSTSKRFSLNGQYSSIFDAVGDGLEVWDLESGRLMDINAAHCQMHGFTREETLAEPTPQFIHPSDAHLVELHLATVRAGEQARGRVRDLRKDGSVLPVEVVAKPVAINGRACMLSVIRDVSEQAHAQETLEDSVAQRTRELTSLLSISRSMSSTIDLASLLRQLLDQLKGVVNYASAAIYAFENGVLELLDYRGTLPSEDVFAGALFEQRLQSTTLTHEPFVMSDSRSYLIAPLVTTGVVIGHLTLMHEMADFYTARHGALAFAFAQQAATALENARRYAEARDAAFRSEQRYQAVFAGASVGLAILDAGGRYVSVNPSLEALFGRSADEIVGATIASGFVAAETQEVQREYTQLLDSGHWSGEVMLRRKDGTTIPVEVTASRVDHPDEPMMIFAVRDISDRKRAEAALAATAERAALRADASAALAAGGSLTDVLTETAAAVARHVPNAMVRIGVHAGLDEGQATVVEAGVPASPKHDTRSDVRIPLRIEDHVTGFLNLVCARQLDEDDADGLAGIAEAVAQYVERRRAQEALDRSTLRFRTLIERSADMLTLHPRDGTVTFVSPATSRLLGYTPADMLHRPLIELVHRRDRKRLQRAYLDLISQPGEAATGRYRMRHADGSWRWIEVTGRNLLDLEVPWWFRDVTSEVEAQEVLERRVDERTRELRSLLEASASLSSTLDLHAVLARMLDQMRQVVEYSAAGVLVTEGSDLATLEYRGQLPREDMLRVRLPRDTVVGRGVEEVVRTRAPLRVDDLGVDGPGYAQVAAKGVSVPRKAFARGRAALYVPMIAHGDVIGVVAMAHPVPGFYTSAHSELALAFAQQAAIAVENARLFEKTEQLAVLESQERRAAEARYRGLFVGAVDALLVTAPSGEILDANPAATALLGWSAEELLGADGPALMSTDSSIHADYRSLRTQGHWEGEMDLRRNDGTRVPLEVRATRIDVPSGPIYLTALRDITERRRAAELLEQRVRERTRELSSLLEVARSMGSTLELRSLVELISAEVKNIVDYTALGVFVRLEDGRYQFFDYAGPLPRERVVGAISADVYEPIWRELERTQQPIIRNELIEDPPIERQLREQGLQPPPRDESPIRSQLVVPWVVQDEVKGAFVLSHSVRHYYTDHHARLTVAFAQHAAVALENARLYAAARDTAALEERQKLARELHDSVSQALYAIALNSAAAQSMLKEESPMRTARLLREVRRLSRAGMAEMRALIFELRPESLTEEGLVGALTKQAAAVQARYGLRVRLAMTREPDVSVQRKEALYRIAQEALQNAVKHAHTRKVDLTLEEIGGELTLDVVDYGRGFDTGASFPGHLGLRSMSERAHALGGRVTIESEPGKGTCIRVVVPLHGV